MEASIHRPRDAPSGDTSRPLVKDQLQDAVLSVESFVREADWPLRLKNAWKHVKETAFQALQIPNAPPSKIAPRDRARLFITSLERRTLGMVIGHVL